MIDRFAPARSARYSRRPIAGNGLPIALGIILVLLGALWFLQGSGLVTIAPILCVAECTPLEGPSLPWAIAGLVALLAGAALLWHRRR